MLRSTLFLAAGALLLTAGATHAAPRCPDLTGTFVLEASSCEPAGGRSTSLTIPTANVNGAVYLSEHRTLQVTQEGCARVTLAPEIPERINDGSFECAYYGDCPLSGRFVPAPVTFAPGTYRGDYSDEIRTVAIQPTAFSLIDEHRWHGAEPTRDAYTFSLTAEGDLLIVKDARRDEYDQRCVLRRTR